MSAFTIERTANGYYLVVGPAGSIRGCHRSRRLAEGQLRAIALKRNAPSTPRASRKAA